MGVDGAPVWPVLALLGCGLLVVVTIGIVAWRSHRRRRPGASATDQPLAEFDLWLNQYQRCVDATDRAGGVVDDLPPSPVVEHLDTLLARMNAELSTAWALASRGRSLTPADGLSPRDPDSIRVYQDLEGAAGRFENIAERVVNIVLRMWHEPDEDRVQREIASADDVFPLVRPRAVETE